MRCETVACGFLAEHVVLWPGSKPIRMCELCCRRAVKVAEVMGFDLPASPLWLVEELQARRARVDDAVARLTGEKLPEPGQEEG